MLRPAPDKPKKPVNPATLKRAITTFSEYRPHLIGILVLVLASAGLGILSPFFLKALINQGLLQNDLGIITHYSLLTLAATLGATVLGLGFGFLSLWVGQQIMRDLRNRLNEHLQGMALEVLHRHAHRRNPKSRLVSDVGGVQNVLSNTVSDVLIQRGHRSSLHARRDDFDGLAPDVAQRRRCCRSVARSWPLKLAISRAVCAKLRRNSWPILNATTQETLSVSGVLC